MYSHVLSYVSSQNGSTFLVYTIWKCVLQNVKKIISLNGCNVIIRWLLGFSYFESMFPCFPWCWLHWVYLVAERSFVCSDLKCFVMLMNSFRYLTCLTRQLWKLVLQSFYLCNDNNQYLSLTTWASEFYCSLLILQCPTFWTVVKCAVPWLLD
jgi:hypothetical protein